MSETKPASLSSQIKNWRGKIINLSRRNNLINHTSYRRTLKIIHPTDEGIIGRLNEEKSWSFFLPPPKPDDLSEEELINWEKKWPRPKKTQIRIDKKYRKETVSSIKRLISINRNRLNDAGIHTLNIAFYRLNWESPSEYGKQIYNSPLFLSDVEIIPNNESFSLKLRDGIWRLNPNLKRLLLADYNIDLNEQKIPEYIEIEDDSTEKLLSYMSKIEDRVKQIIPNARLDKSIFVDVFDSAKEAIYRDLRDNEKEILKNNFIKYLSNERGDKDYSGDISYENLDRDFPPEKLNSIHDSDSSQMMAIIAAKKGESFVISGPPGTGKSQTIANIISELISDNKTVLFVSEKAAALEVVENRLTEAGLGSFLLPLHSENTKRSEFINGLNESLTKIISPPDIKFDAKKMKSHRQKLTDHVKKMNRYHQNIEMSLIDSIARVNELEQETMPPPMNVINGQITKSHINEIRDISNGLCDEWESFMLNEKHPWYGTKIDLSQINQSIKFKVQDIANDISTVSSGILDVEIELQNNWNISVKNLNKHDDLLEILDYSITNCSVLSDNLFNISSINRVRSVLLKLKSLHQVETEFLSLKTDLNSDFSTLKLFEKLEEKEVESIIHSVNYVSETGIINEDIILDNLLFNSIHSTIKEFKLNLELISEKTSSNKDFNSLLSGIKLEDYLLISDSFEKLKTTGKISDKWLSELNFTKYKKSINELSKALELRFAWKNWAEELFSEIIFRPNFDIHLNYKLLNDRKIFRFLNPKYIISNRIVKKSCKNQESFLKENLEKLSDHLLSSRELSGMLTNFHYWDVFQGENLEELEKSNIIIISNLMNDIDQIKKIDLFDSQFIKLMFSNDSNESESLFGLLNTLSDNFSYIRSIDSNFVYLNLVSKVRKLMLKECIDFIETVESNFETLVPTCEGLLSEIDLSIKDICKVFEKSGEYRSELQNNSDILENLYIGAETNWELSNKKVERINDLLIFSDTPISFSSNPFEDFSISIENHKKLISEIKSVLEKMKVYFDRSTISALLEDFSIEEILKWSNNLNNSIDELDSYVRMKRYLANAEEMGFYESLIMFKSLKIDRNLLPDTMECLLIKSWIDIQIAEDFPEGFSSKSHERIRTEFQNLDRDLNLYLRAKILDKCQLNKPPAKIGFGNIITREALKKRKHKPIRELVDEGFDFIRRLKPCMMMSPISVSQFLPPTNELFDVVIFDEASQILPEDAINCIYRGKQHIIAGDRKQLPPTTFFFSNVEIDEDEEFDDFESLLDLSSTSSEVKEFPLLWHYRSKHEDLITFSNKSFYDSSLNTFPSSISNSDYLGLGYHRIEGIYDRGGKRVNREEAEHVYVLIRKWIRYDPGKSIGVVAFSKAQAEEINNVIERNSKQDSDVEEWLLSHESRLDGFFVKNIENVQGDERDIMIISTGYGKDKNGKFYQNLGAISSKETGMRRLNVAITRSRERLEIVSSIEPSDLKSNNTSLQHLRKFLQFANDPGSLDAELEIIGGDFDSPFEEEVAKYIRSLGYQVHVQVGTAGYRIDLGITHPNIPGSFCLAVECDGRMYHSSPVARDRDRIRQDVLERLGWRFHRIWGTEWYREKNPAKNRLKKAIEESTRLPPLTISSTPRKSPDLPLEIENAYKSWKNKESKWNDFVKICGGSVKAKEYQRTIEINSQPIVIDRTEDLGIGVPYQKFISGRNFYGDIYHPSSRTEVLIRTTADKIIKMESPIHEDQLLERMKQPLGMNKVTKKFRIKILQNLKVKSDKDSFYWDGKKKKFVEPRMPTFNFSRKVEHVPIPEIADAIRLVSEQSLNTSGDDEMMKIAGEIFGWTKRGKNVREKLEKSLRYYKRHR